MISNSSQLIMKEIDLMHLPSNFSIMWMKKPVNSPVPVFTPDF